MSKADENRAGAAPRRVYDATYKRHAVDLTLRGDRTVKAVAKELGVPAWTNLLRPGWLAGPDEGGFPTDVMCGSDLG